MTDVDGNVDGNVDGCVSRGGGEKGFVGKTLKAAEVNAHSSRRAFLKSIALFSHIQSSQ